MVIVKSLVKAAACVSLLAVPSACSKSKPPSEEDSSQGGDSETSKKTWMSDYVNLSVYAANAKFGNVGAPDSKIVGGEVAGPNDNPFQVGLLDKAKPDNFRAQFCGGTLISPTVMVTAAHCSDFINANQVQVLTGARSLSSGGTRRDVLRISIHPKWNKQTFDYDVAVWHLASAGTGPFATLATSDGADGSNLLATGWGALSEGGSFPTALYKVVLPLTPRADCNDANSYNGAITDRMVCAGKTGGGVDTCQGDSGGPLARNNQLVGITSWGSGCARPNFFGAYARISNSEIRSFIEAND